MSKSQLSLEDLRKIVATAKEEEKANNCQTQLLIQESIRKKVRKLNPKFCNVWETLEHDMQLNRIIEFVHRYMEDKDLSQATGKKIKKLLAEALKNKTLTVEYNTTLGIIEKVPKLFYDDEDGYYLGTYLNDNQELVSRISKISEYKSGESRLSITTEEYSPGPTPCDKKSLKLRIKTK